MAGAPKKKYAFYGQGRGIPKMDENTTSPATSPYEGSRRLCSPPLFDTQYRNSPPGDYHYPLSSSIYYSGYSSSSSSYSGLSPLSYLNEKYRTPSAFGEVPPLTAGQSLHNVSEEPCSSGILNLSMHEDEENAQKKKKRPQKCRTCANHGEEVDVKGHKWFCPYKNCYCDLCNITKNARLCTKTQQKQIRFRQQTGPTEGMPSYSMNLEMLQLQERSRTAEPMEFPRRKELVEDTENIIEDDLFEKINDLCRPKNSSRR